LIGVPGDDAEEKGSGLVWIFLRIASKDEVADAAVLHADMIVQYRPRDSSLLVPKRTALFLFYLLLQIGSTP
jgi:hypothetical protein